MIAGTLRGGFIVVTLSGVSPLAGRFHGLRPGQMPPGLAIRGNPETNFGIPRRSAVAPARYSSLLRVTRRNVSMGWNVAGTSAKRS